MEKWAFTIDVKAIIFLLCCLPLFWLVRRWGKLRALPKMRLSAMQAFSTESRRVYFQNLPRWLFIAAFSFFLIAFIDPHTVRWSPLEGSGGDFLPKRGVALFFALDQSGSMREEIPVPYDVNASGRMAKIDLLKLVTSRFIAGDPAHHTEGLNGDLVGVVSFARAARVLTPLTLDHQKVLEDIAAIKPMQGDENDGTAIGYAIYKTASMIAATRHYAQELETRGQAPYQIEGSAIIVVTDGLQSPSPLDKGKRLRNMDIPEAAAYAKEQGIHIYIINVDPQIVSDEFIPHRHVMQRAAESTGGQFIVVDGDTPLSTVYQSIARLEKGKIEDERARALPLPHRAFSWYPLCVALGVYCLILAFLFDTLVFRRVP